MNLSFDTLTPTERYKLLCSVVIPRPVAWITTIAENGSVNAAPFSFFNVFAEDPALVIIGINRRRGGERKDTLSNIERRREFTVNMADTALAEAMVGTAADFPPGESETAALGLATAAGHIIATPRLRDAPASLECRLYEARAIGEDRHLVIGEVVSVAAREGLFDPETKRMTVPHYDPVARLFAAGYAKLGEPYDLTVADWRTVRRRRRSADESPGGPA
ncbi:MAG: flavin reductase family protein [Pseudomonadota bacterium]